MPGLASLANLEMAFLPPKPSPLLMPIEFPAGHIRSGQIPAWAQQATSSLRPVIECCFLSIHDANANRDWARSHPKCRFSMLLPFYSKVMLDHVPQEHMHD